MKKKSEFSLFGFYVYYHKRMKHFELIDKGNHSFQPTDFDELVKQTKTFGDEDEYNLIVRYFQNE